MFLLLLLYLPKRFLIRKENELLFKAYLCSLLSSPTFPQLFLYPEGTWFNRHNHERSMAYAEKMNLPQLKYHLQPRTTGFVTILKAMRGRFKALYNVEICFRKTDQFYTQMPSLGDILEGKQFIVDIYIKRTTEEDIPIETEQQKWFLRDMFQMKVYKYTYIFFYI